MRKFKLAKNTRIATREQLNQFLKDKNIWDRQFYYWTTQVTLLKVEIKKAFKYNFWYNNIVVYKTISRNKLKNFYFCPKVSWRVEYNKKNKLYYITRR